MSVQSYRSKERIIFLWFMAPYAVLLNLLIGGSAIFSSFHVFVQSFYISLCYFALIYILSGMVARIIQKRYPDHSLLFRRIVMMLILFYILNILLMQVLYLVYEIPVIRDFVPRRNMEWWATGFSCLVSTIITFIYAAAVGWDNWKNAVIETEQIKNAYQKTKLLALKGQVNPHFLFNCFNSLSSLIQEDAAKAEKFLDEMTKVHRYMLRSDDEQLTSLQQEIAFAHSYLYLIGERFGEAIKTAINIIPEHASLLLPPLSIQTILENIIYNNTASRSSPLKISVKSETGFLYVEHSLNLKSSRNSTIEEEEGLDNLVKKYQLLNGDEVCIKEYPNSRLIILPLISSNKEMAL